MPVTSVRPVVEQIAQTLVDRLSLLTAGYSIFTPVPEVIRPTRNGNWTPKHLQIVVTNGDSEVDEELSLPGNPPATCRKQTFNIHCHLLPSEKDTTPIDELVETMVADVITVVANDSWWWAFDGLAINAEFQTTTPLESDGSFGGVTIPLVVTYRTDEGNPYNVRA